MPVRDAVWQVAHAVADGLLAEQAALYPPLVADGIDGVVAGTLAAAQERDADQTACAIRGAQE